MSTDRKEMNAQQFVQRTLSALQGTEFPANMCSLSIFHEERKLQELSACATEHRRENDQIRRDGL